MSSTNELKKELEKVSKIKDLSERAITIASIIAEALRTIGQDPVLVGGAAVEFYTQGRYTTADIDMVSEGGKELVQVMLNLGFEKFGKDFVNERLKIYVEFPSRSLGPFERYNSIQIDSRMLKIISLEDLIIDRLAAYKFWKSGIDGLNSLKLLESGEIDIPRLRERAKDADVLDALELVERIFKEIIRERLSIEEANQLLESGKEGLK